MSSEEPRRAEPVAFEDRLAIATPEGVEVELTLAGIGSRFMAGLVDWAIQLAVGIALGIALQPAGDTGVALFTLGLFLLIFFYDVLFEVLGGGRTPGKRLNGLQVVRSGGRPITLVRSAIRNILRLIDILPGFYAIGMGFIFATRHNQRLGDLVAGTLVVRVRYGDRRGLEAVAVPAVWRERAESWDVSGVSADAVATVRAFLERRWQLDPGPRATLAAELARRLRPGVAGVPEDTGDEEFLEALVAAKAARG
jgi:uncharacterized RDD family membrane protein YckC